MIRIHKKHSGAPGERESVIEVSRREFLRVAAVAAGAFAVPGALGCGGSTPAGDAGGDAGADAGSDAGSDGGPAADAGFDLPTLGGAPDTPQGRAIAAFVDTVVPGRHRDPTGAVGGIDTGAPAFFFDTSLPAATSFNLHRVRQFSSLTPEQREAVVEEALVTTPVFAFAVQLAKLAYFASPEAGAHLGYPGANTGYASDPDFSFGRAMATEITSDGNPT